MSASGGCLSQVSRVYYVILCIIETRSSLGTIFLFFREALGVLKKGDDARTIQKAERLLKKSINRQPTFLPSHLSLASLQLYQKDSPEECLKTITVALEIFPENKELLQLQLDAKAVEQNMGHMATAGVVTVPYLGEIPFRPRS